MLTYGVDADQAFKLLMWRSQQTNTKLRALAAQLVSELALVDGASLRRQVDHLMLTVHERVGSNVERR